MAEIFLIYDMAKMVYMVKIAITTKLDIVHCLTILTSVKGMLDWFIQPCNVGTIIFTP